MKVLMPEDVIKMGLREFWDRFGWRPADALEKHYFAATGKRLAADTRSAIEAGILGPVDTSHVVMDEEPAP